MYELTPNKPPKTKGGIPLWFRISGLLATVLLILVVVLLTAVPGLQPIRPAPTRPAPTATPLTIIRTAWIEARDTCPESFEFKDLVVPGANLWTSPGTSTSKGNIRHASKINILDETDNWTHIEQFGQTGYIQSFFVVDYDPSKEFHQATGKRYCALCSSESICEPTDHP